jgi:hypothetical protein
MMRLAILLSVVLVGIADLNAANEPDRISVAETADIFEITVPVSGLIMKVPKGGLKQATPAGVGSTASRRYFYLEDGERHIWVSGWFEAEAEYPGIEKFWREEIAAMKKNRVPLPEHSKFVALGNWQAVTYQMPAAHGSNPNIRAHWLQAGTWIDVHVSLQSDLSANEAMGQLERLLAGIVVSKRNR